MDQDSLGDIGSDEFSTSSEIISEETHSLMECSPGDCPDVHITRSVKQEEGIWGNIARSCVLMASMVKCRSIPLIENLNQCSIDNLSTTWLTVD